MTRDAIDEVNVAIGMRLRTLRGARTQAEFAQELKVPKNTYGNYERAERQIGAPALIALEAKGWSSRWVLTGLGDQRWNDGSSPEPRHVTTGNASLASAQYVAWMQVRKFAVRAHQIVNLMRLAHPEIGELADDGCLHEAIHDLLRVDWPVEASEVAP